MFDEKVDMVLYMVENGWLVLSDGETVEDFAEKADYENLLAWWRFFCEG